MGNRKTKIICTIGPAVESRSQLTQLAESGMDIARLNFSHGTHSDFLRILEDIRSLEKNFRHPIGVLADIQGPKIRVGDLEGGEVVLPNGEKVWIVPGLECGGKRGSQILISTTYENFAKDVPAGKRILLDDGLLALESEAVDKQGLRCRVVHGGVLKAHKGMNVPEVSFSVHAITEKDYEDILFCLENGVDYIALSFVRSAQEIRHLKEFIHSRQKRALVIAKIEMREAIQNLNEIIDASDGILVARGDLAVEVGNERVPVLQKKIVRQCNLRGKPVIIATQMLMSMVNNPRPSRAEASDVANAIVDGVDAVMLSNETAIGQYPIEAIKMMSSIAEQMESQDEISKVIGSDQWILPPSSEKAMALLQSAVRLASTLKASSIAVVTQSGFSPQLVSKCRPKTRVIAITGSLETYRQLSLMWGVEAVLMGDMESLITQTAVFEAIGQRLLALNLCRSGDTIVITAGLPRLAHGSTNTIKVQSI